MQNFIQDKKLTMTNNLYLKKPKTLNQRLSGVVANWPNASGTSCIHAQCRQTSIRADEDAHSFLRYSFVPSTSVRCESHMTYPHRLSASGTYSPKRFEYLPPHRRVQAGGGEAASSPANGMTCLLSSAWSLSLNWLSRRCLWAANATASSKKSPPTCRDFVIRSRRSSWVSAMIIFRARFRPPCPMVPFKSPACSD